jgi:non-homologous end joining protein Ku
MKVSGGVRQTMKEQKHHIYLSNQERSEIIESLIDFKNLRMQQGKYTDAVDEVLVKVIRAKKKKLKVVYI